MKGHCQGGPRSRGSFGVGSLTPRPIGASGERPGSNAGPYSLPMGRAPFPCHFNPVAQGRRVPPRSWGADAQGVRLMGVLERGQMAARPAGGAARAARNSGEVPGLSQKPRLPAQKVTLEPREFGRDSSRSGEEGSVSRISPSTSRAACPGPGRSKGTPTPDT